MNAIKFIQQHGVEKAREVVDGAPGCATHLSGFTGQIYKDSGDVVYVWDGMKYHKSIYEHTQGMISLFDLKRLVESVDLVKEHYTLERAIDYANSTYTAPEIKVCLLDAIAYYKSIYGGEHV